MHDAVTSVHVVDSLAASARAVERVIDSVLPTPSGPEGRLYEAMRYAALGGGKRLRPFLVLAGAKICGVAEEPALRVGAAVELVHSYSLVHDDLPAMDDDDLRRGQPSCHVAFDEATAILAGDALLTLAFGVLADPSTSADAAVRSELVAALALAAGPHGMVGGQMIDLAAEHSAAGAPLIARLERMKTGALISFSCEAGAVLGSAPAATRETLRTYGYELGLAFQITDDLLDVEGDESNVGKKVGKDAAAGKATFVSVLGVDGARQEARTVVDTAVARLEPFGRDADDLRAVAQFVLDRKT